MFKKGDKVKLKKGSRYYIENTLHNPAEVEGVVFKIKGADFIEVRWDNGENNSYTEEDLELAADKAGILENYNKFKKIPDVKNVISQEQRVDLAEIAKYNSFQEAGLTYEEVGTLLSLYETALRRAEEKLNFFELLFENGIRSLEKGDINIEAGKEIIEQVKAPKLRRPNSSNFGEFTTTINSDIEGGFTGEVPKSPGVEKRERLSTKALEDYSFSVKFKHEIDAKLKHELKENQVEEYEEDYIDDDLLDEDEL